MYVEYLIVILIIQSLISIKNYLKLLELDF